MSHVPKNSTPLEWATTEELIQELNRRSRSVILARTDLDGRHYSVRFAGGRMELLGLVIHAQCELQQAIAHQAREG